MKITKLPLITTLCAGALLCGGFTAYAAPTDGFTQSSSSFNVQNRADAPLAERFTFSGGIYTTTVYAGEERVEMRWENWPNQNVANQWEGEVNPDVILVDINLPGMSGIDCVAKLKVDMSDLQFVMLTTYLDTNLIFSALRAGASGYLLKNSPSSDLVQAIQQVRLGGAPMSLQIARKVVDHFHQIPQPASDVEKLTAREKEILVLLAKRRLYKEIADSLDISYDTVRAHVRHIYEKLHVQSRTEAAARFFGRD